MLTEIYMNPLDGAWISESYVSRAGFDALLLKVVDPNQAPTPSVSHGTSSKPGDGKAVHTLKSAVVATIAPEHAALAPTAGPRIRSSIMRSGMYSDRMDIG